VINRATIRAACVCLSSFAVNSIERQSIARSSCIDRIEYRRGVELEMAKQPTKQEMDDWFKVFDTDGSGKVDVKDLKAIIKGYYEWQEQSVDDAKINADVAVTRRSLLT